MKQGVSAEDRPPRPPTFGGVLKRKDKQAKTDGEMTEDDVLMNANVVKKCNLI